MKYQIKRATLVSALILSAVCANAQDKKQKEDINIQPVTIINLQHGLKNNQEDYKLTGQDLLTHDGGEILTNLPEISGIRKSAAYGLDPVLRGFTADQLNIVVDGVVQAIQACPNRMDTPSSQIAPNIIDNVEIIKGPYSLRYGNTFGATINFRSAQAEYTNENKVNGRLSSNYITNGDVTQTEGKLGFTGEKYHINAFGAFGKGNDYNAGDDISINSDFQRGSVGVKSTFMLNDTNELDFSVINNFAKDTQFPALMMDLRSDKTWLSNINHTMQFTGENNFNQLKTQVYYTNVDHVMDNLTKVMDTRMVNAVTNAVTETFGGRSELEMNIGSGLLFTGIDIKKQQAEGVRTREMLMGPMKGKVFNENAWQDGSITNTGLFGEYNYSTTERDYIVSARLDINNANTNNTAEKFSNVYNDVDVTQINPSISLGATQHINDNTDLGLWLGRAQRSASLTERYINFFAVGMDPYELVGNPNLDSEVNYQADLVADFNTNNFNINVDVFANYLTNYIQGEINQELQPALKKSPGVRQFQNIGDVSKYGIETKIGHTISNNVSQQLQFAYTYAQDLERDQPVAQIAPFDMRYKLTSSFINNKLKPTLQARYVAEQNRVSTEYKETASPSFFVLDFKANAQLTKQLHLQAGINNILDEQYAEHLSRSIRGTTPTPLYAPGRSGSFTLSFNFK